MVVVGVGVGVGGLYCRAGEYKGRKEGAAEGGGERQTSGGESERSRKGDGEAGFSKSH